MKGDGTSATGRADAESSYLASWMAFLFSAMGTTETKKVFGLSLPVKDKSEPFH